MGGAREGGAFLDEFRKAGFSDARILRRFRNARTKNKKVEAVDVVAVK